MGRFGAFVKPAGRAAPWHYAPEPMAAPDDPIERFREALARARETESFDASRCVLATADGRGRPAARYVLLKDADARGFVFYTNFDSRKAEQLAENPWAALAFHWSSQDEQVRVEGPVERVSDQEADEYFASRDRGSQIGAWASKQSHPARSRAQLEEAYREVEQRFEGRSIPRPEFWGGYRIRPDRIEFWHSRAHRLHDRLAYERRDDGWHVTRLQP